MNLAKLLAAPLTDILKGIPGGTPPFPLEEIAARQWNVLREDLPLPLAVIKRSALEHNSRWMRAFVELTGVKIAPHGKTTMAPQLFARQLADGAWGMTFATADQVRVAREFGVSRVILANQLIGRANIHYVLEELKHDANFDFYCLVDSLAGVEMLAAAARAQAVGRPLNVLLEGGVPGARCGARDPQSALAIARAVRAHEPVLALRGVEGFEGSVSGPTPAETIARVEQFLDFLAALATACDEERLFGDGPVILSAGGSAYYDLVASRFTNGLLARPTEVVIRSGCYLTHDSIFYHRLHEQLQARSPELRQLGAGLQPALEGWAYVQSRPEPTRAILTCGKRDLSYDLHLPTLERWYRRALHDRPAPMPPDHALVGLNDQHAIAGIPADSPLEVGDMVSLGVSHPCTTFDRWAWLPVVDDDYQVVEAVRTFF